MMNVTILKNKNYKFNDYIINKYKFIYIENKFSEDIFSIIYNSFGIVWWYLDDLYKKDINFLFKNIDEFKEQFDVKMFDNDLDAKKYLFKYGIDYLNNNVLYINKYQIFWYLNFRKQKSIYLYDR